MLFRLTDRESPSLFLSLSLSLCLVYDMHDIRELEQVEIFEVPQRFSE